MLRCIQKYSADGTKVFVLELHELGQVPQTAVVGAQHDPISQLG